MDHTNKKWHSLNDLKARIQLLGRETVVSFNGHTLTTDQYQYTLAFGKLTVQKLDGLAPQNDK